ncbi:MAG: ATP-binding protein [Maribacter sp.]
MNVSDYEIECELKSAFYDKAYSPFVILNKDMDFVDVNEAAISTMGIEKESFIGKNILDVFPYLKDTERYDAYRNVIDTGVTIGFDELLFKGEFAESKFMSKAFKIGDYLGITTLDVTHVIGTIEKLKKTQASLTKVNKNLKKKNQELEEFSYVAAHDLRAPLTNLKSLVHMMKDVNPATDSMDPLVDKLSTVAQVMCDKIRALNMVIAIKSSFNGTKEDISFSDAMSNIKSMHSKEIIECRTIIKEDFSSCPQIRYNQAQLTSILDSLMSNSLKYRHPKRKLSIKVETKIVKGKTQLVFRDNGLGFDQDLSDKIFTLFKRMHTHVDGLGIGLYITNSIINDNGGSIQVKSQVNKGTELTIIF